MPVFDRNGTQIHYLVEGAGEPLLLLHQATDSLDYWYRNNYVSELSLKYLCILPDARGHGNSDKPTDPNAYAATEIAQDYEKLLDHLGVTQCHIWGYSMGGYYTQCLAALIPNRIKSIIVGAAFPQVVKSEFIDRLIEGFTSGVENGEDALIQYFKDWWGGMSEAVEFRYRTLDFAAILAYLNRPKSNIDLVESLSGSQLPALFYAGSDDVIPHRYASLVPEIMPNATFVSFDGYTHGSMSPQADLILKSVFPFLDRNSLL